MSDAVSRGPAPPRVPVWRVLLSGPMLLMLLTGFFSGVPLLLTGSTLQAWLTGAKVDLGAIGLYALVGLPYTLKFVWAPALDRFSWTRLGRRRTWMLATQLALTLLIAILGGVRPEQQPLTVAVLALGVAFASASQDVAVDAYRRELLPDRALGLGSTFFVYGYRLGMLVSGALALFLADHVSWDLVYAAMALLMGVGALVTLALPEPTLPAAPPRTLAEAVIEPFLELWRRPSPWWLLAFILLYKLGDQLALSMTMPFVLAIGFTMTEAAAITKVVGLWALIGGSFIGGLAMVRLGIHRALWIFGGVQAVSILMFAALATSGKVWGVYAVAVALEQAAAGMSSSAYTAFLASVTHRRFTATQFALFSSLMGVPRVLLAAPAGYLAAALDWPGYFVFCAFAALPGLWLLPKVAPWGGAGEG